MHENGMSTSRNCAESAMTEMGLCPSSETLKKIVWAINPWIQAEAEARELRMGKAAEGFIAYLDGRLAGYEACESAHPGSSYYGSMLWDVTKIKEKFLEIVNEQH